MASCAWHIHVHVCSTFDQAYVTVKLTVLDTAHSDPVLVMHHLTCCTCTHAP